MNNFQSFALSSIGAAFMLASGAHAAAMLTAANGMTLYTFDKDKSAVSTCEGDCAKMWPAYLGMKGDKAMKDWSMVARADGKMQWTYDGRPVYFYAGDKKKGDKAGDGMNGLWHVIPE